MTRNKNGGQVQDTIRIVGTVDAIKRVFPGIPREKLEELRDKKQSGKAQKS